MGVRVSVSAASALVVLTAAISGQEWSRFRGPNGSGVSSSTEVPVHFGPDANLDWKAEVPFSTSSPILTEDVVYLTGSNESHLIVMCLEREDGGERWVQKLERTHPTKTHEANDSASPTPTTDGENVYAFFPELGLVSFDSEGEQRWMLPTDPFVSFYGLSGSPIVSGNRVILLCDQQQGSYLLAVDKGSGELLWKTRREGMIESWTTPVLFPEQNPTTIIAFGTYSIRGYSLETGEELWRHGGTGYTPIPSPIVAGDRLFASVAYHGEQPLPTYDSLLVHDADQDELLTPEELGKSPLGGHFGWVDADKDDLVTREEWEFCRSGMNSRDHGLYALEFEDAAEGGVTPVERWRHKRSLPEIATPILYEDVIYLFKHGGVVTTLDANTGEPRKTARLPGSGRTYNSSPIAADGKIFIGNDAGEVHVLQAGPDWKVLATNELGEEIQASPALADGILYVRTAESLFAFRSGDTP